MLTRWYNFFYAVVWDETHDDVLASRMARRLFVTMQVDGAP